MQIYLLVSFSPGAGEMAWQLRVSATFVENLGSVSNTGIQWYTTAYNSRLKESDSLV